MAEVEVVTFEAAHGRHLSGMLYKAVGQRWGGLVIGPATGFRQSFYAGFATFAAGRGLDVLTFDWRGVGKSRLPGSLRGDPASLVDWGRLDLPAALERLSQETGGLPLFLLGHSAGGQLIGLMPNAAKLSAVATISSSTGYLEELHPALRLKAKLLMNVYMPLSAAALGYVPARWLGWGEDLPKAVALQWAAWCRQKGYVQNAFAKDRNLDHHADVRAPLLSWSATDDPIATEANVDDLLRAFTHAKVTRLRRTPESLGKKAVGHIGFFKQDLSSEWGVVVDWLQSFTVGI
jgi:predicted alpha/beta hydrolase